jgi:hypothetical protein
MTYLGNDIGPIEPISNPRHRQSKRFGFNMAFRWGKATNQGAATSPCHRALYRVTVCIGF